MPTKFRVVQDEDNEQETKEENSDQTTQENGSKEEKKGKQARQERKAELERELANEEQALKDEASEAAESIAEDEPDNSEVNKEAKDEAAAIATGHGLTQQEENRLAEAISAKVMEKIQGTNNEPRPRSRVPDRKPKPTHFSERTILGRNRQR